MKNFQYVNERLTSLLKEYILKHTKQQQKQNSSEFEIELRYQLETLLDKFYVDLFFEIRDLLHTNKIDINQTQHLDKVIDSFYNNKIYPYLTTTCL